MQTSTGIYSNRAKRLEEALSAYRQRLKNKLRDDLAYVSLAEVFNSLGRYEEALKAYEFAEDEAAPQS